MPGHISARLKRSSTAVSETMLKGPSMPTKSTGRSIGHHSNKIRLDQSLLLLVSGGIQLSSLSSNCSPQDSPNGSTWSLTLSLWLHSHWQWLVASTHWSQTANSLVQEIQVIQRNELIYTFLLNKIISKYFSWKLIKIY